MALEDADGVGDDVAFTLTDTVADPDTVKVAEASECVVDRLCDSEVVAVAVCDTVGVALAAGDVLWFQCPHSPKPMRQPAPQYSAVSPQKPYTLQHSLSGHTAPAPAGPHSGVVPAAMDGTAVGVVVAVSEVVAVEVDVAVEVEVLLDVLVKLVVDEWLRFTVPHSPTSERQPGPQYSTVVPQ